MLTYKYEARIPVTGKLVKGNVQAENEQAAAAAIKKQGQVPLSVSPANKAGGGRFSKVKTKDKILFSRQLSTLINAGLPLLQSLRQVATQTTNKALQTTINDIISRVEGGKALSVALAAHPKVFDRIFISLVQAGETSGNLDETLERLANQQEKDADIMSKVKGAMMYPAIVMLVMFGVLGFMVVKVLPTVKGIYDGIAGVTLPLVTVVLLAISDFVINYWWIAIIILVAAVLGGRRWIKSDSGGRVFDKLKMRAWPIAILFNKMYMARFARTGQSLTASGVPLLQVIDIAGDAVNNIYIKESLDSAAVKVRGGKTLSESLDGDPNFLPLVPGMISIGEQSGSLEVMMGKIADYYEKEVDNEIKSVSTIIEPVLMVIMGGMALVIVSAILLPIYGLVTQSGFSGGISG